MERKGRKRRSEERTELHSGFIPKRAVGEEGSKKRYTDRWMDGRRQLLFCGAHCL